ncbi:uncharacterized protein GGS25DRAFT_268905 [Hypoxylon fragiforme]|uniref:uncharacterized protein n=1 Tax=Hypoxylon fragiforme TaxID=63214 RepID=UPI0020C5FCB5|nr:uncharacterized protein GGS25DRAFT_268905 [Hypoxylon fragiforme]KAI2608295.1 hypothetical protein GGS25DRAFT_268905 [Hypoxylon fragiforme]
MTMDSNPPIDETSQPALESEIADLELRLQQAKERLAKSSNHPKANHHASSSIPPSPPPSPFFASSTQSAHHYLLLLSDSALPLGSFACSSGLESYLAHTSPSSSSSRRHPSNNNPFSSFLPLSISSYAGTNLPHALAAHRDPSPSSIARIDDALDAATICTVGRRASVAQGRALLAIWEKSLGGPSSRALAPFAEALRRAGTAEAGDLLLPPPASAHLAPLFGAVAALCGLTLRQAAYVFMLSHVKALVSAAVRAGLFGPYHAQRVLAGELVQALLVDAVEREWETGVEEAGQRVPSVDLWVGRHEVLYSRIFNS